MKRITDIGRLYGITDNPVLKRGEEMQQVGFLENAWISIDQGKIAGYGTMDQLPDEAAENISASGMMVLPSFVDCHTHLVFPASREQEFVDRIAGLSYQDIARRGGGILNSAGKLAQMDEEDLFLQAKKRLEKVVQSGTGALEIKSGYGLSTAGELKMLRVINRLKQEFSLPIKSTFLGAHAFPSEFIGREDKYVDLIVNDMLPRVAELRADYVDVFCEEGYFTVEQTRRIGEKAVELGIPVRLHANQFNSSGAIQLAAELKAISVEHLEVLTGPDIETLQNSDLIAVALPACSFFLGIPYTPLQNLLNHQIPFALASDFNPGSSPVYDLHFVFALACIQQKILPEVAFNALTVNAACALGMQNQVGSIGVGQLANLNFYNLDNLAQIPYYPAARLIEKVMIRGEFI